MFRLLKYYKAFLLGIQNSMEYRANFLLNIFSGIFAVIIQCFLWTAIFDNAGSSTVYGYTYNQLITYTVMSGLVSKLVSTGFEHEISNDIKNGGLSKFLIQPINYFFYRICCFIGQKICQIIFIGIISTGVLGILSFTLNFNFKYENIVYAFIPVVLSIALNFLIFYCVSTIAFWMTEVFALFWGINLLTLILSGAIFPLDIFGENILNIFNFLPFKYTTYFPINILTGRIDIASIFLGIYIQLIWVAILLLLSNLLWKLGMRKYVAIGG